MLKKVGAILKGESAIWNKVVAVMLVMTLTFTNFILLGVVAGKGAISYALENLEGQNSSTQHENVKFDAYFMESGSKKHTLELDSKDTTKLYFALNVKNKGYLKNGTIELAKANYNIAGKLEASEVMQKIEKNIIKLKQLNYGTEAIVDLPISLEIGNELEIDKINKESSLILKGTYVTENGEEVAINKEIKINLNWISQNKINLTSSISKYKIYETEEKILVQEKVKISKEEKTLPIAKTKVEVEIPKYNNIEPEKIIVNANSLGLTTGQEDEKIEFTSQNWKEDKENKKIIIEVENKEQDGKVWSGLGEDEYTITYIYGKEAYESKQDSNSIAKKVKATVYGYSNSEATANNEEVVELKEEIGQVVSGKIEIKEDIIKGNMYANCNSNNREYETVYNVKQTVEIPYIEGIEEIKLTEEAEKFIDDKENKNSTKIGGVNYTYYRKTSISKSNFDKILGDEGYIAIENEAGTEIGRIDKNTNKENGNYVITYSENQGTIVLQTSKPVIEGNLIIEQEKAIKADLPYLRNQIVSFKQIETTINVEANGQTNTANATRQLEETNTKVDMSINKTTINDQNQNIEIKLELNNTNNKSDLYVNPKFTIELPENIEATNIEKVEVLFDEELTVKKSEIQTNAQGKKEIKIELVGTQTKFNTVPNTNGTTILIQAKVKGTKTGEGKAKLKVENANAVQYATDGISEAVLNVAISTYLDITLGSTTATKPTKKTVATNIENTGETTTTEEIKQNITIDTTYNDDEMIYIPGEEYIYRVVLENITPEDAGEVKWNEADSAKKDELIEQLVELSNIENKTEEQETQEISINDELNALYMKYAVGEEKEFYDLLALQREGIDSLNTEYNELNSIENKTETQQKRMEDIETLIKNETPENMNEQQIQRYKELGVKLENGTINNKDDMSVTNMELRVKLTQYLKYKSTEVTDETTKKLTENIIFEETNNTVLVKLDEFPEDSKYIYLTIKTEVENIGEDKKELENIINVSYEQNKKQFKEEGKSNITIGKGDTEDTEDIETTVTIENEEIKKISDPNAERTLQQI